jgi:hypothetical protein
LQIRDTRCFVESRLEDLSALWDGEPRIAREEIAKHVGKITLKPILRMYIATGVWDWLGVLGTAAAMVVPGERNGLNICPYDLSIWLLRDLRKFTLMGLLLQFKLASFGHHASWHKANGFARMRHSC